NVNSGGALCFDGNDIYALRGNGSITFWRYNSAPNTWTARANLPAKVNYGGALVKVGSSTVFRTLIDVAPSLALNGDTATVRLTVTSGAAVTNVIPTLWVTNLVNGATAALLSGPVPASAIIAANGTTN